MLDPLVDFLKVLGIYDPGRLGWVTVVLAFILAILVAWWFTPRMRLYSMQVGWADEPNPRRVNKEPLPNAGGLAIFASVVLALIIATLLRRIVILDVQVQIYAILLGVRWSSWRGSSTTSTAYPPSSG